MSLEKLFEAVDENVFTPELKESLKTTFNEAVEAKAEELISDRIEEEINILDEKSKEHIQMLEAKSDETVTQKVEEIIESLDKYLDRIVEEFIKETQDSLDESVKSEKAEMINEAFKSMVIATGMEMSAIQEAKDESSIQTKLDQLTGKYDELVEENIKVTAENDKLFKMGLIQEMKEGLSIVESEKFEKMAELVEFTKDQEFVKRLETIKENVTGVENSDIAESHENINENVTKPIWSHLV